MKKCKNYNIECPYVLQSEFAPIPCIGSQEQCDQIRKIRNGEYSVFIICSVRNTSDEYKKKLEDYVSEIESSQIKVHLPHRDTDQDTSGLNICSQNADAIKNADEVHIFYNSESQGTHFDMGVAFANDKKIIVVENEIYGEGKSYPRMLDEWQNR